MATLGHAFAALLMRLSDRLSLQPSEFLAFPSFQTRLSLEQVEQVSSPEKVDTTDGAAARRRALSIEAFARLVNHIPTGRRDFVLSGQPLWDIYRQVLQNAETAQKPDAESKKAMVEFRDRKETMLLNERRSVSGISEAYWPVGVNPIVDLRDAQSWTRISIDEKAIDEAAKKIPKDLEEWLQARDLMRELDAVKVRGMTIDVCHLSIRRNWFDQNLLTSKNWRLQDGSVLSDGGNPPTGLLPALVEGVVLIRKLEIELEPASAEGLAFLSKTNNQLKLMSAPHVLKSALATAPARPLDSFARKPKPGNAASDKSETETATSGLPSPVIIKAQQIIERIDKGVAAARLELGQVEQQLQVQRAELARNERQVSAIQRQIASANRPQGGVTVTVSSSPRNKPFKNITGLIKGGKARKSRPAKKVVHVDVSALQARIASHNQRIAALRSETPKLEAKQRSINERIKKLNAEKLSYEKLSTDPFGADEVFLFAAVCLRTPKSPNPSPKLFST